MEAVLPLVLALLAVGVVLYLSYVFSRYLATGAAKINKSKYINIIDRVVLGQDRMIFIAMIGEKYYLIGSAAQSIQILTELDETTLTQCDSGIAGAERNTGFKSALSDILSRKEK